jgi:DNA-binding NarL/FixJ family response regulator
MRPIRVVIADDHALFRAGIRSFLEQQADIKVIGEAVDGWDAVREAQRLRPDVILMDIAMPQMRGLEATCEISGEMPEIRILALSMHNREEFLFSMINSGGSGYVLKDCEPEELLNAIRTVFSGEIYIASTIARTILHDYMTRRKDEFLEREDNLTLRQKQVLKLVVEGKSSAEIAELLCLSVRTIEKHRSNIMRTLELENIQGLMKYALQFGYL